LFVFFVSFSSSMGDSDLFFAFLDVDLDVGLDVDVDISVFPVAIGGRTGE
jgi:hypothetical protein